MLLFGLHASPCIPSMYGHLLLRGVSAGAGREALGGQVLVEKRQSSTSLVLGLVFLCGAYPNIVVL
jgi:hypothetical protein